MNLEFSSFADAGQPAKERIIFKALVDIDIGFYAVFRSDNSDGKPTAGWKNAYWFPNGEIKANDLVVLYTKEGTQSTKLMSGGRTAHFFYWGIKHAQWGDTQHGAVLVETSDWDFRVPAR